MAGGPAGRCASSSPAPFQNTWIPMQNKQERGQAHDDGRSGRADQIRKAP